MCLILHIETSLEKKYARSLRQSVDDDQLKSNTLTKVDVDYILG